MNKIREFVENDVPVAASLFQRVFRRTDRPPSASLLQYFRDIYFQNPWIRGDMPSLVFESDGKVRGFLGSFSLPLTFRGRTIWARIGGNYMVDPEMRNPFAGVLLLKKFFSGPQHLCLTDTGNETARKLWTGLGGVVNVPQSMQWIRPLHPLAVAREGLSSSFPRILFKLIGPAAFVVDRVIDRSMRTSPKGSARELDVDELRKSIELASTGYSVTPSYSRDSIRWLLREAGLKRQFGELNSRGVFDREGRMEGWFLCYSQRGGMVQVAQLGVLGSSGGNVLEHLFEHARVHGGIAVVGRMEPRLVGELSRNNCFFVHRNSFFLMYSQDDGLLSAIQSGDAFLSRLEGEWWTRFQGDDFDNGRI